jgi:hypothetical protein
MFATTLFSLQTPNFMLTSLLLPFNGKYRPVAKGVFYFKDKKQRKNILLFLQKKQKKIT